MEMPRPKTLKTFMYSMASGRFSRFAGAPGGFAARSRAVSTRVIAVLHADFGCFPFGRGPRHENVPGRRIFIRKREADPKSLSRLSPR